MKEKRLNVQETSLTHQYRLFNATSRIDCSVPISFYNSPKSSHYKPFAQRRANSAEAKRFAFNDNLFPQSRSRMSNRSEPVIRARRRAVPSIERQQPRPSSAYDGVPSKIAMLRCYQPPMQRKKVDKVPTDLAQLFPESLLPEVPQKAVANVVHLNLVAPKTDENARELIDAFKDSVLTEVIMRGVYTDSIIKDCLNDQIARNDRLSVSELRKATIEILDELGISMAAENEERPNSHKSRKVSLTHAQIAVDSQHSSPSTVTVNKQRNSSAVGAERKKFQQVHSKNENLQEMDDIVVRKNVKESVQKDAENNTKYSIGHSNYDEVENKSNSSTSSMNSSSNSSTMSSDSNPSSLNQISIKESLPDSTTTSSVSNLLLVSDSDEVNSKQAIESPQNSRSTFQASRQRSVSIDESNSSYGAFRLDATPPSRLSTSSESIQLLKPEFIGDGTSIPDVQPSLTSRSNSLISTALDDSFIRQASMSVLDEIIERARRLE